MKVRIIKDCQYSFDGVHVQTLKEGSVHDLLTGDVAIIVDDLKFGEIVVEKPITVESPAKSILPPVMKLIKQPEVKKEPEAPRPKKKKKKKRE
jgi:hypothetical protein